MADRDYLIRLTKELTEAGKLVEAGWVGLRLAVIPPNASAVQLEEMRMAFFAGAQHLFSSLMNIMEEDAEPTEADLHKMELVDLELGEFAKQFELRIRKPGGSA